MTRRITIHYFALFRERVGQGDETISTDAATAGDLFAECQRRHPGLESFAASKVAINDELSEWSSSISDGDAVLFFPPVAGG